MRWYYTPQLGADLSQGFDKFVKHDDSVAEHLDSLLKTIMHHEQETKKKIDANVVTWRGVLTKVRRPLHFHLAYAGHPLGPVANMIADNVESIRRP